MIQEQEKQVKDKEEAKRQTLTSKSTRAIGLLNSQLKVFRLACLLCLILPQYNIHGFSHQHRASCERKDARARGV